MYPAKLSPVAIALRHPKRPDLTAMVTASASEPGRYQLTWADDAGPSGHTTRDTAEAAVRHAVEEGYRLDFAFSDDARAIVERVQAEHEARVAEVDAWIADAC
jgi:hypothetical protein